MAITQSSQTWMNIPPGSRLRITGQATAPDYTILVDSDDGITRRVICQGDEVIPGPCGHRLDGGKTYIDRVVIRILKDATTVDVVAEILDPNGQPVTSPFGFRAVGTAGSPYMIVLNILVD